MSKKQTAIQWIIEQLQAPCRGVPSHIIEEALQMEREQIEEAFNKGYDDHEYNNTEIKFGADPDVYYTQTYKTLQS